MKKISHPTWQPMNQVFSDGSHLIISKKGNAEMWEAVYQTTRIIAKMVRVARQTERDQGRR